MTRNLVIRIRRLEAKHKAAAGKPKGVIGGIGQLIVDPEKPGHLKFSEPLGGFKAYVFHPG